MKGNLTNKELLQMVLQQTKTNAENQLTFAGKVSTFINEQQLFNSEVRGFLESNDKTKQKGIIEQVAINTQDIHDIQTDRKIEKKVWGISGAAIGTFAGWIAKFIPFG